MSLFPRPSIFRGHQLSPVIFPLAIDAAAVITESNNNHGNDGSDNNSNTTITSTVMDVTKIISSVSSPSDTFFSSPLSTSNPIIFPIPQNSKHVVVNDSSPPTSSDTSPTSSIDTSIIATSTPSSHPPNTAVATTTRGKGNGNSETEPEGISPDLRNRTTFGLFLLGVILIPLFLIFIYRVCWEHFYHSRKEYLALRNGGAFAGAGSVEAIVESGGVVGGNREQTADTKKWWQWNKGWGWGRAKGLNTKSAKTNSEASPEVQGGNGIIGSGRPGGGVFNSANANVTGDVRSPERVMVTGIGSPADEGGRHGSDESSDSRAAEEYAANGYGIGGYRGERIPPPKRVGSIPAQTRDGAHLHPGYGFEPVEY